MNPDDFPDDMIRRLFALPPGEFLEVLPQFFEGNRELLGTALVFHSGLADPANPVDPSDSAATGAVLRARLADSDPDTAVRYVQLIASFMHLPPPEAGFMSMEQYESIQKDSTVGALSALEGFAGITGQDYPPQVGWEARLGHKLHACLAGASDDAILEFLGTLAAGCSHNPNRGLHASLGIIEAFFGVFAGQYTSCVLLARLGPWCRQLSIGFTKLLAAWAPYLKGAGREAEAKALLESVFRWTEADLRHGRELAACVRSRITSLPPEFASMIWIQIPQIMHQWMPRAEVLCFIEAGFGIQKRSYSLPRALVERLARSPEADHEYFPETFISRVVGLLQALANARESENGLQVLQAVVDAAVSSSSHQSFDEKLQRWIRTLPVHSRAEVNRVAAITLFWAGKQSETIRCLEQVFDLSPNDYADVNTLAAKLRYTPHAFSPEEPVALATLLMASLFEIPRRHRDAKAIADAYLWRIIDMARVPLANAGAVLPICMMLEFWLERSNAAVAYERLAETVNFLRQCLDVRGFHLEDRERFIRDIASLRRRIVQIGYQQAGKNPEALSCVLGWDIELGQRILFERYRFHCPSNVLASHLNSAGLSADWSLSDDQLEYDGYLSPGGRGGLTGRLGRTTGESSPVDAFGPDLADTPDQRCQIAQEILRSGISAEQVASVLGGNTLLIRAGFLSDGQLFWNAFRCDGVKLVCVASATPGGNASAAGFAEAVAWHDRLLEALWAEHNKPVRPLAEWCDELQPYAEDLRQRLAMRRNARFDPEAVGRNAELILSSCRKAGDNDFGFGAWVRSALPADWSAVGDRQPWSEAWTRMENTLRILATAPLEQQLDAATAAFLTRIAAMWDLSALGPHLTLDTDIVVDLEDQLHAVPVAFLPIRTPGDAVQRLFERVRSVRSNLSLLLPLLHRAERLPEWPSAAGGLLTVSWFGNDDTARPGARWLHHGQRLLARRHGRAWASAGDHPVGCGGAIALGLARGGGLRVLTICGHGRDGGPGVCLSGGEAWSGEGCDLSRVSLLLSVSCSLGRLAQQPGVPDVEGFTATLLARRARAALACRWPVHAVQAAGFANAVTDEYLKTDQQSACYDRAAALARARKQLFGPNSFQTAVGLNTAAAFELYGEG
jgi:hypothetical protein